MLGELRKISTRELSRLLCIKLVEIAMERIASALLSLDVPPKDGNTASENVQRPKQLMKYAIVYWIATQEFNVMSLSKIPKDKRQEGESATLKAEREWLTKIVKIGGECKYSNVVQSSKLL